MQPISPTTPVQAGTLLLHLELGLARVERVTPDGFELGWTRPGRHHPRRISRGALHQSYQRCDEAGFFALCLADLQSLLRMLREEPARAAALLVQELGGPPQRASLERWLVGPGLVPAATFDRWWLEVSQAEVAADPTRVPRAEPPEDDETLTQGEAPPQDPWDALGRVGGDELIALAEAIALAIAPAHLGGAGMALTPRDIEPLPGGGVRVRGGGRGDPADDLRVMGWLLFERALDGDLPDAPHALMNALAALAPPLPPAALPLLEELVVPDEALLRIDSPAIARAWSAARTHERLRTLSPPRPDLSLDIGVESHVGRAKALVSQVNQDCLAVAGDRRRGLLVVADGISICDTGSGDEASRVAVRALVDALSPSPQVPLGDPERARRRAADALRAANEAVCRASLRHAKGDITGRIPMGTTVVLALFEGPMVDLISMGDSPALLITPSGAAQLTPDHNVRLERLRGLMPPGPDSGAAITSFLGAFNPEGRPLPLPFFHRRLRLLPGETLILCTDGVTDYAASSGVELHRLLAELDHEAGSAQELASALIEAANLGGGGDNATAIVARVPVDG